MKANLNRWLMTIVALLLLQFTGSGSKVFAQENFVSHGQARSMIVYAPKNLTANRPLLISMHGMNQDAPYQRSQANYEAVADTANFVVVYPNGINKGWDLGSDKDINFILDIIDEMVKRHQIDRNRVYLSGFSMGGMMTYYAMTKIADKIAAFAPVSGYNMGGPNATSSRPIPIFHVHGTGDDVCVYSPVQSHIDAWVKRNGCNTTPIIEKPKTGPANTSAQIIRYTGGEGGVEVAHLKLPDKGHWHSNDPVVAMTNIEIWNFCKRWSLIPAPQVKTVAPLNLSTNLSSDTDRTFTITFDKPVVCEGIRAGLIANGTTLLKLKETGESSTLTFEIPAEKTIKDGLYTLKIMYVVGTDGSTCPTLLYYFGYGNTDMTPVIEKKEAAINVDSRMKYQHVTGFGGFSPSPTWQYWLNDADMDKLFGKGDNQLGLTILRTYISPNKNYWGSGVANIKRANKYGAFVFASPWTPPSEWKSNKSAINGGALLESHYDDWAKQLNSYYTYMKGQGAKVHAVSIQNEPDWSPEYESCTWTGEQMVKFLKQSRKYIECKVIAPEAIHFSRNIHEPILNDAEACDALDILGGHFYGWDGSSYPLAKQKGKEVWMTEYLINERQQNEGKDIDWATDGFLFARSVNDAMLANMSAWVHYSLKRYYGCLGDGQFGTANGQITKRGYVLSQYAKYVSGSTRIRHSISDDSKILSSSAYLSQTGDSVIVMVLNPSDNYFSTTLTLPFYAQNGWQIVTSTDKNAEKSAISLGEETYTANVTVLPYSVSTYIFVKTSPRTDMPELGPQGDYYFSDNFDLYGGGVIPDGWRAKYEDGIRTAGNYGLGPRTMTFSAEGAMENALYFRAGTDAAGYVSYGEEQDFPLTLIPGKYTLTYSTVGWKATPAIRLQVLKPNGSAMTSMMSTPANYISEQGPSSRIETTKDFLVEFEVVDGGDYVLKWTIAKAASGLNEALLGNIRLVNESLTGIESVITNPSNSDNALYDLSGRKVLNAKTGLYIRNGRKFVVK